MSDITIDELRALSSKIANDPDAVYDLDLEQTIALRKYLNPLGNVISAKKNYINMGIVNWREKYLRKLHMTALVGYLFRTLTEYEPEEEIERENSRFEKKSKNLSQEDLNNLKKEHEARIGLIKTTTDTIIRRFLNRNFNYNPDKHLRGSHSSNPSDSDGKSKNDVIRDSISIVNTASDVGSKLQSKSDTTYRYIRSMLLTTNSVANDVTALTKSVLHTFTDPGISAEDKQGILYKKYKQLVDLSADIKKLAEPLSRADTLDAWKVDPPTEIFYQFDRYLTNHYEQLREIVQALYNEKSDFEFGIILYDAFKSADAAREYKIQHESEFRTEVITVESGAVTLLGPFKENRQRVDFYNKNTEIMKRMMDQLESDHKLGKDLMEKQLKDKKKKNIAEAGPDAPELSSYIKAMNITKELSGANRVLTKEETAKLVETNEIARKIREDYEVPDDGIQVDMFFPEAQDDGSLKLKKTKFYTREERLLHLTDTKYGDKYQPVDT